MKKYKVKETGEVLYNTSPEMVVDLLNSTSKLPADTSREFMLDYAKRSMIYRDVDIRATDYQSFIEDLLAIGDLEEI
jgi:hypothetical protein